MRLRALPALRPLFGVTRMLFDWLVTEPIVTANPAHPLSGPKRVVTAGQNTEPAAERTRRLLDSIDTSAVVGRRDRALISVMTFAVAQIVAVVADVAMRVEDYHPKVKRRRVRLHEKGGTPY